MNAIQATAERLYNLDVYNALDYDETPETIADTIKSDPVAIINHLLDIIDELQQ